MKILFAAPRLPHRGVVSGHQIVYQRMRRLCARGHEVGLACFVRPGEEARVAEWRGTLLDLETVPDPTLQRRPWSRRLRRARVLDELRSPEMERRIGDMVQRSHYDVVIAEFSEMGRFLHHNLYLPAVRRVMSVHQCLTMASQKRVQVLGFTPAGLWERLIRDHLRKAEFTIYRSADHVIVLTPQERFAMRQFCPELHTAMVPGGVDTDVFRPPDAPAAPAGIVFTGYYSHEQNCDAVRWFVSDVWPKIRSRHPELFFYVVGPNPPQDLLNLSWKDPMIVVTGEVGDVRPYLASSYLFVCPVRMGSGLRMKSLEAMSYELPVVTTSLGAEGLPIQPGRNGFIADDVNLMARQINLLLDDAVLRAKVGRLARETVVGRYSWDRSVHALEEVLYEITGRLARGPASHAM